MLTSLVLVASLLQPPQQSTLPPTGKGQWWEVFRKEANAGDELSMGLRQGVVHGCMDGAEMLVISQTQSLDEYRKRRDRLMRSDLTMDQILAKVDGFYAEPANQTLGVCTAVLTALRPPAAR